MSAKNVIVTWHKRLHFEGKAGDNKVSFDVPKEDGGTDKGPAPKEMLLMSMGACSGMNVADILTKMQLPFDFLSVGVTAELSSEDTHPIMFTSFSMEYRIEGPALVSDKVARAVELSQTKYCSIVAMMRKVAPISYTVYANDVQISSVAAPSV